MQETKPIVDDNFLCSRNDNIDNTSFDAIRTIAMPGTNIEWSMEMIGEVNDFIEGLLSSHNIPACYPWRDDDGHICYSTRKRCKHCTADAKKAKENNE